MQVKDVSDRQVLAGYTTAACPAVFITDYLTAQGIPAKVAERKIERLIRRGYLEWGVSICSSYLTAAGRAYMTELGLVPPPVDARPFADRWADVQAQAPAVLF